MIQSHKGESIKTSTIIKTRRAERKNDRTHNIGKVLMLEHFTVAITAHEQLLMRWSAPNELAHGSNGFGEEIEIEAPLWEVSRHKQDTRILTSKSNRRSKLTSALPFHMTIEVSIEHHSSREVASVAVHLITKRMGSLDLGLNGQGVLRSAHVIRLIRIRIKHKFRIPKKSFEHFLKQCNIPGNARGKVREERGE